MYVKWKGLDPLRVQPFIKNHPAQLETAAVIRSSVQVNLVEEEQEPVETGGDGSFRVPRSGHDLSFLRFYFHSRKWT